MDCGLDITAKPACPLVFPASGSLTLTAAAIWLASERLLHPGWLHIENGLIAGYGTGKPPYPGSITDLGDVFLTPGLIDAHVHLDLDPGSRPDLMERVRLAAGYGLAAVRDGGDQCGRVLKARPMIQDLMYLASPGVAMFAPGRYGAFLGRPVDGLEAMRQTVHEMVRLGADHIKALASGPVSLKKFGLVGGPQFDMARLTCLSLLAKKVGLPFMVHANGPEAVAQCLAAGVDSVEHGYFMGKENLAKLADAQTAWIPTIQPLASLLARETCPATRDILAGTIEGQVKQLAAARRYGVRAVLGTDAGAPGLAVGPGLYQEMYWWRQAGYSTQEILSAATSGPAELMGSPNKLGRLVTGAPAFMAGFRLASPPTSRKPEPDLEHPPVFVGRPDLQASHQTRKDQTGSCPG